MVLELFFLCIFFEKCTIKNAVLQDGIFMEGDAADNPPDQHGNRGRKRVGTCNMQYGMHKSAFLSTYPLTEYLVILYTIENIQGGTAQL